MEESLATVRVTMIRQRAMKKTIMPIKKWKVLIHRLLKRRGQNSMLSDSSMSKDFLVSLPR